MTTDAHLQSIAQNIKCFVTDVDGVLTDGTLYYTAEGETIKAFHVQDGAAIQRLMRDHGIPVAIISGKESPMLSRRCELLGITHVYTNISNKPEALAKLCTELNITQAEVAYIGDDWIDKAVMEQVALPIAVANARPAIKAVAAWITPSSGGHGAVADAIEMLVDLKQG